MKQILSDGLTDLQRELKEVTRRLDSETFMYPEQVKRLERYRLSLIKQIKEDFPNDSEEDS